jgi:large subunit ribosomal protein L6
MSRVGKKVIEIPKDVSVVITDTKINVKGKHGSLEREIKDLVTLSLEDNQLFVKRINDEKKTRSYHGLMRALIQNMITGVDQLFTKTLIAEGVGYKFQAEKTKLIINVGFTHPVEFQIPNDITVKQEGPTKIHISGIDREKVGLLASKIRDMRPPEPYKGKGILYDGEKIIRKAGKTGK